MTPDQLTPENLDRIAREGTFEEVTEACHASGFTWPPLRQAFTRMRNERLAAQYAAAAQVHR